MSVTTADIDAFNRDGFIRLPALLDPAEVAAAGREITRLTLALNGKPAPMEDRTT